jgi:hypothetical protein
MPAGTNPKRRYSACAPVFDTRTSSVTLWLPRATAARVSASSSRVAMPWRCHAGSTTIVVTWLSSIAWNEPA